MDLMEPVELETWAPPEGLAPRLAASLEYAYRLSRLRELPPDPTERPKGRRYAETSDGALRGWRIWLPIQSNLSDVRLSSPVRKVLWPRGVFTAACPNECGKVASANCQCGIYAYGDPSLARRTLRRKNCALSVDTFVVGELAGWGRVSLHEMGWRSERALITALWAKGLWAERMRALADYYEVPVRPWDESSRLGL